MSQTIKSDRVKVFLQNVRLLSEDERANLPEAKRKAAEADGQSGVWVEVTCPAGACSTGDGKITIPAGMVEGETDKRGIWLNLFCPDDECVIEASSQLP
ncbi:hypothetical protein [Desulfatitalea alkaliphila]|uniref:Uncharacterized protein n=1 Tax=Desulfatitalea alkaliphila TaxID=2929485 RepID=A0AA41R6L2_9BACT|nr:hypothetical protein [Desulfatitalea alkaliphila]MCJ8502537.1 hypothetical protein [Desulfatitalea alkaliphila]